MNKENRKESPARISIIIPIYKVEQYLDKCISSVTNQTYHNLEIILVDDGSPDRCGSICDNYALTDSRIKVIHKKNGGLSEARNYGIDQATGDYIGFVDGDDWVENDMFEALYTKAVEYRADISICGFYTVKNNKVNLPHIAAHDIEYSGEEALSELAKDRITNHAWNKLYKRELFTEIRYPVGMAFEDIATTYRLFAVSTKIVYIRACKYYYLLREASITGQKVYYSADYLQVCRMQYKALAGMVPNISEVLYHSMIKSAVYFYNYAIREHGINQQIKRIILKELKDIIKEKDYQSLAAKDKIMVKLLVGSPNIYQFLYKLIRVKENGRLLHSLAEVYSAITSTMTLSRKMNKKAPYIYIIGTPEHNNLGDHAIAYAEIQYIKEKFPDYKILELSESMLCLRLLLLRRFIKSSDIIAYHGGGNIGNQYLYYEKQRRRVIRSFPNNKIIILPQTIYFTADKGGRKQLQISCDTYNRHRKLIIAAREQNSYHIAKYYFANTQSLLVPDIVLSLKEMRENNQRDGALLCLRDDVEKSITDENAAAIFQCLEQYYHKVIHTDTCVDYNVPISGRANALEAKWYQFLQAEIVITDRIHGMIFAALTGTPCIALNNYNYKIEGTYRWLKHLPYIRHINNPDELEKTIQQLQVLPAKEHLYDNRPLMQYFDFITFSIRSASIDELKNQEEASYGL